MFIENEIRVYQIPADRVELPSNFAQLAGLRRLRERLLANGYWLEATQHAGVVRFVVMGPLLDIGDDARRLFWGHIETRQRRQAPLVLNPDPALGATTSSGRVLERRIEAGRSVTSTLIPPSGSCSGSGSTRIDNRGRLERYMRSHLVLAHLFVGLPANHACYFPIYAKCVELGMAAKINCGLPGPMRQARLQQTMNLDEVLLAFPETSGRTVRPKVPMRQAGADYPIVLLKRSNVRGGKGVGHRHRDR